MCDSDSRLTKKSDSNSDSNQLWNHFRINPDSRIRIVHDWYLPTVEKQHTVNRDQSYILRNKISEQSVHVTRRCWSSHTIWYYTSNLDLSLCLYMYMYSTIYSCVWGTEQIFDDRTTVEPCLKTASIKRPPCHKDHFSVPPFSLFY